MARHSISLTERDLEEAVCEWVRACYPSMQDVTVSVTLSSGEDDRTGTRNYGATASADLVPPTRVTSNERGDPLCPSCGKTPIVCACVD